VASATSIAIPAGAYTITLTGTTTITEVTGLVPRKEYIFSYPSGAGLIFMGEAMQAGDVLLATDA
jgi:cytochrome c biogenesis protein CcdA